MLEEAPQEFLVRKRHGAALAVVRIVLPTERHVGIGHLDKTMVGDGDAMRVAGQIVQYVFGAAERFLRVDHPVLAEQYTQECGERLLVSERTTGSEEDELVLAKGAPQSRHELSTKDLVEHFHWQEEVIARTDPAQMIRGQSAARHHAVHVGMRL